jgi:simple sugar transport system permease protein
MNDDLLQLFLSPDFVQAALRFATPLIGAATGEILAERAGVINIGLEGMMLVGAFTGVLGSALSGSVWGGLALAILAGGLVGLLHAGATVLLGTDQVISGAAINLGALGLTAFLNREIFGQTPPPVPSFEPFRLPLLGDLPLVGPALFNHIPLVYIVLALAPLATLALFRTPWGLRLRAVGEAPEAAASAGIHVRRYQIVAVTLGGMFAGLAGTYFSLGNVRVFTENMAAGNGFIALAVVIVARWRPNRAVLVALLFGAASALAFRAQAFQLALPYELLLALPYALTLLVYFLRGAKAYSAAPGS